MTSNTVRLPVSKDTGYLTFPYQVTERYGMGGVSQVVCQATGTHLHLTVPLDVGAVVFRLPFSEWRIGDVYHRSTNEKRVHVGRWTRDIDAEAETSKSMYVEATVHKTELQP